MAAALRRSPHHLEIREADTVRLLHPLSSLNSMITALMLTVALVTGCSSPQAAPTPTPTATPSSPAQPQPPTGAAPVPQGQTGALTGDKPTAIEQAYLKDMRFSPATMTVQVGTVVLWSNLDSTDHTVTGPGWELGPFGNGQAWAHTFNKVGTEEIHCRLHPEMKMTVTITELKQ